MSLLELELLLSVLGVLLVLLDPPVEGSVLDELVPIEVDESDVPVAACGCLLAVASVLLCCARA